MPLRIKRFDPQYLSEMSKKDKQLAEKGIRVFIMFNYIRMIAGIVSFIILLLLVTVIGLPLTKGLPVYLGLAAIFIYMIIISMLKFKKNFSLGK